MDREKIERINFLAVKAKSGKLTPEEKQEQQALRNEYREGFRKNLTAQLNNTYIVDEDGNKTRLKRRKD